MTISQFDKNGREFPKRVENAMEKGEIARREQFLHFPQCFEKACTADIIKPGPVWERVNQYSAQYFSKPLTALPHNHCRNNGQQWKKNESCPKVIINPQKEYWLSRGSNQRPHILNCSIF